MNHDTSPFALSLGVPKGCRSSSSALRRLERAARKKAGRRPAHIENISRRKREMRDHHARLRVQAAQAASQGLLAQLAANFMRKINHRSQGR